MCEKHRLLNLLRGYSFALTEASFYLDGHPCDCKALAYYHKNKQLHEETLRLYNEKFGPLTSRQVTNTNRWTWIDNPWPWELEA